MLDRKKLVAILLKGEISDKDFSKLCDNPCVFSIDTQKSEAVGNRVYTYCKVTLDDGTFYEIKVNKGKN